MPFAYRSPSSPDALHGLDRIGARPSARLRRSRCRCRPASPRTSLLLSRGSSQLDQPFPIGVAGPTSKRHKRTVEHRSPSVDAGPVRPVSTSTSTSTSSSNDERAVRSSPASRRAPRDRHAGTARPLHRIRRRDRRQAVRVDASRSVVVTPSDHAPGSLPARYAPACARTARPRRARSVRARAAPHRARSRAARSRSIGQSSGALCVGPSTSHSMSSPTGMRSPISPRSTRRRVVEPHAERLEPVRPVLERRLARSARPTARRRGSRGPGAAAGPRGRARRPARRRSGTTRYVQHHATCSFG